MKQNKLSFDDMQYVWQRKQDKDGSKKWTNCTHSESLEYEHHFNADNQELPDNFEVLGLFRRMNRKHNRKKKAVLPELKQLNMDKNKETASIKMENAGYQQKGYRRCGQCLFWNHSSTKGCMVCSMMSPQRRSEWKWKDDDGFYRLYEPDISEKLEKLKKNKHFRIQTSIWDYTSPSSAVRDLLHSLRLRHVV